MSMFKTVEGAELEPEDFGWKAENNVATVTASRPERRNPPFREFMFDAGVEHNDVQSQQAD